MSEASLSASRLERTLGELVAAGIAEPKHLATLLGLEARHIARPLRTLALQGALERDPGGGVALTHRGRAWLGMQEPVPVVADAPASSARTVAQRVPLRPDRTSAAAPALVDGASSEASVLADRATPEVALSGERTESGGGLAYRLTAQASASAEGTEAGPSPAERAHRLRLLPPSAADQHALEDTDGRHPGGAHASDRDRVGTSAATRLPDVDPVPGNSVRRTGPLAWIGFEGPSPRSVNSSALPEGLRRVPGGLRGVRLGWPFAGIALPKVRLALSEVRLGVAGVQLSPSASRRIAAVVASSVVLVVGVRVGLPAWGLGAVAPAVGGPAVGGQALGEAATRDEPAPRDAAPVGTLTPPLATPVPSPVSALSAERWVVVQHTNGLGLVLRPAPGSAARVLLLEDGARVRVTGDGVQQAGRAWLPVASLSGKTGWVAADFVAAAP